MKITYRDKRDLDHLRSLINKGKYQAEYEQRQSLDEIKIALRRYKGPPIGSPLPDGWIDLGVHLYGFILSDEFPKMLAEKALVYIFFTTVIKPFYKRIFRKQNQESKNKSICIVTDELSQDRRYSIYFILYEGLDDEHLEDALKTLPDLREKIIDLLNISGFGGGDTIRISYLRDRWYIQRFELSMNQTTDPETCKIMHEYTDYNRRYKRASIFNKVADFLRKSARGASK